MNIKVGIIDRDSVFVERFLHTMNTKYDDIEIFAFPKLKKALIAAAESNFHLLLIDSASVSREELNKNENLIPKQCKLMLMSAKKASDDSDETDVIGKYQSAASWHERICHICICQAEDKNKGGSDVRQMTDSKMCLFVAGDSGVKASAAASMFCHYLKQNGKTAVAVEPSAMPGEQLAKICDILRESFGAEYVLATVHPETVEDVVPAFINCNRLILVTNGTSAANKTIEKYMAELPSKALMNNLEAYRKYLLLYVEYDPKHGRLIDDDTINKLGGIDLAGSTDVPFKKLVTLLDV